MAAVCPICPMCPIPQDRPFCDVKSGGLFHRNLTLMTQDESVFMLAAAHIGHDRGVWLSSADTLGAWFFSLAANGPCRAYPQRCLMTPSGCMSPDMDMKWSPTLTRYSGSYSHVVQIPKGKLSCFTQSFTPRLLLTAPRTQASHRARILLEASNPRKVWVIQCYRPRQVARSCDDFTSLCCFCMLLIQYEGKGSSRTVTPTPVVLISPNYGDLLLMGLPTSAPTRKVRVV